MGVYEVQNLLGLKALTFYLLSPIITICVTLLCFNQKNCHKTLNVITLCAKRYGFTHLYYIISTLLLSAFITSFITLCAVIKSQFSTLK